MAHQFIKRGISLYGLHDIKHPLCLAFLFPLSFFYLFSHASHAGTELKKQDRIKIFCRNSWKAKPPRMKLQKQTIERVTIHHSAREVLDSSPEIEIQKLQMFHQGHPLKPMADIAYHYLISREGLIYLGRDSRFEGATLTNYNPKGHLLIALLGNFDISSPPKKQRQALIDLLRVVLQSYQLKMATVATHYDYANTQCPGKNLRLWVKSIEFKSLLRDALEAGEIEVEISCETPFPQTKPQTTAIDSKLDAPKRTLRSLQINPW